MTFPCIGFNGSQLPGNVPSMNTSFVRPAISKNGLKKNKYANQIFLHPFHETNHFFQVFHMERTCADVAGMPRVVVQVSHKSGV